MDFTELNTWASNTTTLIQVITVGIAVIVVVAAGLVAVTSMGNSQRLELARNMVIGAVIGVFIVLAAPKIAQLIIGLNSYSPLAAPAPTPHP